MFRSEKVWKLNFLPGVGLKIAFAVSKPVVTIPKKKKENIVMNYNSNSNKNDFYNNSLCINAFGRFCYK